MTIRISLLASDLNNIMSIRLHRVTSGRLH